MGKNCNIGVLLYETVWMSLKYECKLCQTAQKIKNKFKKRN